MPTSIVTTLKNTNLTLGGAEEILWVSILQKGWRAQKRITVNLDGARSKFSWFIFVLGTGSDTFPLNLSIVHNGKETVSRVYIRTILSDTARIDCEAVSTVLPKAHGADTYLSSKALLLSESAHAHAIPSLEILVDDIRAGHAASVDRFSPDDLFYLTSRGLSELEAKKLLITGFMLADCSKLSDPKLVSKITQAIEDGISHSSFLNAKRSSFIQEQSD